MRVKRRPRIRWFSLFFLLVLPVAAYGGVPEVSHVMVTDVTTTSFSVIWAASEPSTADLEVYEEEAGTEAADYAVITPHPIESGDEDIRMAIKTAAEDNGVMKVRVTDLEPDTTYYFTTITISTSPDNTTTYYPDAAMAVTTESETVRTYESGEDILPFSNDLIIEACYLDDGVTFAEGTLLVATVEGANHPITAFVGDGVDPPYALIDLNNVFSHNTYENLDLSQGLNLTLLNFRGLLGNSIVTHSVPEDQSLSEVKPAEFGLMAGWNFVSFQLEPGDTAIDTILASIIDPPLHEVLLSVWAWDTQTDSWLKYNPMFPADHPINSLKEIHSCRGYWIEMGAGAEASLSINGDFNPDPIMLRNGWNMVALRSIENLDISDAVASLSGKLESVWTWDVRTNGWLKYNPMFPVGHPINSLKYIMPGKAYWLNMYEDSEW